MTCYCKGICYRYKDTTKLISHKWYFSERKRCQRCNIFIKWEGIRCPCCGSQLRTRPECRKNREQFKKDKEQLLMNNAR